MTDDSKDYVSDNDGLEVPEATSRLQDVEPPTEDVMDFEEAHAPEVKNDDYEPGDTDCSAIEGDRGVVDDIPEECSLTEDSVNQVTMDDVFERIGCLEELFKSKISRSEYEEQVLKRYSDEIHEYKSDLYKKIILPLIKEVISVRDAACAMLERARSEGATESAIALDSVEFLRDMLETALDNYGVAVHRPEVGSLPEKGTERPIGRVKTATRDEHGTIAAVMNDAYLMDGKCISPAKVKVFAYDGALEDSAEVQQTPESPDAESERQANAVDVEAESGSGMPAPAPVYKPEQD